MHTTSELTREKWKRFKISNDNGVRVTILNYGGIISELLVPDQNGKLENVVLGYKNEADYQTDPHYFGAIIGRVAGRIQSGSFELNGNTYDLEKNDGQNCLHSGTRGFHKVVWNAETFQTTDTVGIKLTHISPDGEGGFPGTVQAAVTYSLNNDNQLIMDYEATSDKTTALTLTNHSYFNLSGHTKHTVEQHQVKMNGSRFVELDPNLIPTGNLLDVTGTPFDFRQGRKLADGIKAGTEQNAVAGNGYDHYLTFDQAKGNIHVKDETSGRVMDIETNQPGLVMYTANNLDKGLDLKEGKSRKYSGVCFETQGCPASLHHEGLPSTVLGANTLYSKRTTFTFGTK